MSTTISAKVPTIEVLNVTLASISDDVAVKHLLNINSSDNYTNYSNVTAMLPTLGYQTVKDLSKDLLFSTASNKSLFVFDRQSNVSLYNISLSSIDHFNNATVVYASINATNSDVVIQEEVKLQVNVADAGKIKTDVDGIFLQEDGSNITAHDHVRILNNVTGDAFIEFNFAYALGVENKAYNFTNTQVTYDTVVAQDFIGRNLTFNVSSSSNITLGVYRIHNDAPTLTITSNDVYKTVDNTEASSDVTSLSNLLTTIPATTRSFTLNVTASLADSQFPLKRTAGSDQYFSLSGTGMDDSVSLVDNLVTGFNVTVKGRQVELVQNNMTGTSYTDKLTVQSVVENSQNVSGNTTITFDSSDRYAFSGGNGISMSATVDYDSMAESYKTVLQPSWVFDRLARPTNGLITDYTPSANLTSALVSTSNTTAFIARVDATHSLVLSKEFDANKIYGVDDADDIVLNSAADLVVTGNVTNSDTIIDWRIRFDSNATTFTESISGSNANIVPIVNIDGPLFNYGDMNGPINNKNDYNILLSNITNGFNQRYILELPTLLGMDANITGDVRPNTLRIAAYNNDVPITGARPVSISPYHTNSPVNVSNERLVSGVYSVTYELDAHLSLVADNAVRVRLTISYPVNQASRTIEIGSLSFTDFSLFKSHKATFQTTVDGTNWVDVASKGFDLRGDDISGLGPVTRLCVKNRGVAESSDNSYIIHLKSDETTTLYSAKILKITADNLVTLAGVDGFDTLLEPVAASLNVTGTDSIVSGQTKRAISLSFANGVKIDYTYTREPLDNPVKFMYLPYAWVKSRNDDFALREVVDGTSYAIGTDTGVNVTFANVNDGGSVFGLTLIGMIVLKSDQYSVTGPGGPISNKVIPGNRVLVDNAGNTRTGLTSLWYRGFPNGIQFKLDRSAPVKVFVNGVEIKTLTDADVSAAGNNVSLSDDTQYNIRVSKIPILNDQYAVYTLQKSTINAFYKSGDVEISYTGTIGSTLKLSTILGVSQNRLADNLLKLFHLNNYYVDGTLLSIAYTQPDIVIGYSPTYAISNRSDVLGSMNGLFYTEDKRIADTQVDEVVSFGGRYSLKLTQAYRSAAATTFYTVAPVVANIRCKTATSVGFNPANNLKAFELTAVNGQNLDIPLDISVNGRTASYKLNVSLDLTLARTIANYPLRNFIFRPHTFKVFGDSIPSGQDSLTSTSHRYDQNIAAFASIAGFNASETEIVVNWNSEYFPRTSEDGGKHKIGTIQPESNVGLTSYQLAFNVTATNVTTGQFDLVPVVRKYVSKRYSNALVLGGYVKEFEINTAGDNKEFDIAPSVANKIDYPYKYCLSAYPAADSLIGPIINASRTISVSAGAKVDLIVRLRNAMSDADRHKIATAYHKLIAPTSTDAFNIVKIDAKDQFVVKDYMDNLSMRIGPNGRMYVGDVSSYSFAIYSNTVGGNAINSPYLPLHNTVVGLGDGTLRGEAAPSV